MKIRLLFILFTFSLYSFILIPGDDDKRFPKILDDDRNRYLQLAKYEDAIKTSKPVEILPEVEATPQEEYELVTYHRVKRGETLMMIAGYNHIYGDRRKWKIIYEANKANIDDPNVLVPGQILLVPR